MVFRGAVVGVGRLSLDVLLAVLDDLGQDLACHVREGDSGSGAIVLDHLLDRRRLERHGLVDLEGLTVRAREGDLLLLRRRRRHYALEKTAFVRWMDCASALIGHTRGNKNIGRTYEPILLWNKAKFSFEIALHYSLSFEIPFFF